MNQIDYLTGKSGKSARDVFFYYAGPEPSAVRYKNWKLIFAIAPETAFGFAQGVQHQYMAAVINLKRDPFETSWGDWMKAGFGISGALAGPFSANIYDWNMLPIGQELWLKELETYKQFPPIQAPESWNLDQVTQRIRNQAGHASQ